jgi:hypothetical protein
MRILAKFVTVCMLLLLGVPAVACMLPGAEMTPEEKACCKEMAGECDEMGMDPAHGCCTRLQHDDVQLLQSTPNARHTLENTGACIAANSAGVAPQTTALYTPPALEHSPPESPPHSFSILRI